MSVPTEELHAKRKKKTCSCPNYNDEKLKKSIFPDSELWQLRYIVLDSDIYNLKRTRCIKCRV